MTSSPTPAVLPDARAREVLIEKLREVAALEDRNMKRHAHAIRTFATEAADYLATPPASDAAVPTRSTLALEKLIDLFDHALATPGYGADAASREEYDDHVDRARKEAAAVPKAASNAAVPAGKDACSQCKGRRGELAPGREPDELCDCCYGDAAAPKVASDTGAGLREALEAPAPVVGQGKYAYATRDQPPAMLLESARDVLFHEAEPHVIVDAWNIAQMAAAGLSAALATPTDATDGGANG